MDSFSLFNVFHLLEFFFTVTVELRELRRPSSHSQAFILTHTHTHTHTPALFALPCIAIFTISKQIHQKSDGNFLSLFSVKRNKSVAFKCCHKTSLWYFRQDILLLCQMKHFQGMGQIVDMLETWSNKSLSFLITSALFLVPWRKHLLDSHTARWLQRLLAFRQGTGNITD